MIFLKNVGVPVTPYSTLLTFRDSNKFFKLYGDLIENMTSYDFNISHSNPKDQKLSYEFGKELKFNVKQKGRKSPRDQSLINSFKSPAIMASGVSTKFLASYLDELCNRLKLLSQEKQASNNSDIKNDEIFAIVDKFLEYKCISKKQHMQILIKCSLIQK